MAITEQLKTNKFGVQISKIDFSDLKKDRKRNQRIFNFFKEKKIIAIGNSKALEEIMENSDTPETLILMCYMYGLMVQNIFPIIGSDERVKLFNAWCKPSLQENKKVYEILEKLSKAARLAFDHMSRMEAHGHALLEQLQQIHEQATGILGEAWADHIIVQEFKHAFKIKNEDK